MFAIFRSGPAWGQSDSQTAAQAVNEHAFEAFQLFRQMTKGNFCFSPFSAHQIAALLAEGASGETQQELLAMTHLPAAPEPRQHASLALKDELTRSAAQRAFVLEIANSLWVPPAAVFLPEFEALAKQAFGAAVLPLPGDDPIAACTVVNQWVHERTRGRIPYLLEPSAFRPGTVVLLNTIYLKASWESPFELAKSKPRQFYPPSGKTALIPTMFQISTFRYGDGAGWKCLEMPFVQNELKMRILLPENEVERERLEASMTPMTWEKVTLGLAPFDVNVMVPRFSFSTQLDMKDLWRALGVREAFTQGKAKLDQMIGAKPYFVQSVTHQATIVVNEIGAEASAATAAVSDPFGSSEVIQKRRKVSFIANRPFVWLIEHPSSGLILFMGRFAGE